jgi:single-strand DNA-binding protein
MIQVNFNGRLGADAEVRQGKEGKEFITFSVAVNEKRNGEKKTTWMRVRSDNMRIAPYLKKGSLVFISGNEDVSTFVDRNGSTQVSRDVRAHNIDFISVGNANENGSAENRTTTVAPTTVSETTITPTAMSMSCGTLQPQMASSVISEDSDDLPF